MRERKNNGGHAFPGWHIDEDGEELYQDGMTLRDYFATNAPDIDFQYWEDFQSDKPNGHITEAMAEWNYLYADAMLKERNK